MRDRVPTSETLPSQRQPVHSVHVFTHDSRQVPRDRHTHRQAHTLHRRNATVLLSMGEKICNSCRSVSTPAKAASIRAPLCWNVLLRSQIHSRSLRLEGKGVFKEDPVLPWRQEGWRTVYTAWLSLGNSLPPGRHLILLPECLNYCTQEPY